MAGTWIVRLELSDDEGAVTTDDHQFRVLAPPKAKLEQIPPDEPIGTITGNLVLSGERSVDPDSPCAGPDYCHTSIEPPVVGVAPTLSTFSWRLIDVPLEHQDSFREGGVDEVLGISASADRLELRGDRLLPGKWTFQLEVEDGEGETDSDRLQVRVFDENQAPIAIVTPPRRHLVLDGEITQAISVSGEGSYDVDDAEAGSPDPDIASFAWTLVSGPSCPEALDPTGGPEWVLFAEDQTVPAHCLGTWEVELEVTDRDLPSMTGVRRPTSISRVATSLCASTRRQPSTPC